MQWYANYNLPIYNYEIYPQHLFSRYQKIDPQVYVVSDRIYSFQSIFILDHGRPPTTQETLGKIL